MKQFFKTFLPVTFFFIIVLFGNFLCLQHNNKKEFKLSSVNLFMNKIEMRKRPQNSTCECQTYYVSWLWHITCMYRIPAPLSILIYFGGKCPRIEAFQSDKYLHTPHRLLSFPFDRRPYFYYAY